MQITANALRQGYMTKPLWPMENYVIGELSKKIDRQALEFRERFDAQELTPKRSRKRQRSFSR